jgi:hypothetical protein
MGASRAQGRTQRRSAPRTAARGLALVHDAAGRPSQHEVVRLVDVSRRGLRLSTAGVPPQPGDRITLTLVGGRAFHHVIADVIWSSFDEIGLALAEELSSRVLEALDASTADPPGTAASPCRPS